ncbi:hypothetical protein ACB092_05G046100 [Castanea dentata]
MGWPLVKSLLWSLLLFVQIHEHRACIEEERMGLLELKAFLKSHTNYTKPLLPTWVYETKGGCCSWEWVNCSTNTGHVINLTLSSINQWQDGVRGTWFFNLSLLQPFKELRILDLSNNGIAGWLGNEEFCALKKLEEIDLARNGFEGMLPPCLKNLTSLSYLVISHNQFNGNLSSSPIASLTSLEYIDLSYNLFEGLFSFNIFANHSQLKVIQLFNDNKKLDIETENHSWDPLFQLKVLVLSNCNLNRLAGNFHKFLLDQHELEVVDISHSKLNGSFPIWLLENNTGLKRLNLRSNSFSGEFHLPSDHYMNLRWLDLSDNHFDGKLQENIGKRIPKLKFLNLSQNQFEGNLPSSIGDMSNLRVLDLSFNNFSGEVPMELVANCTSLKVLSLSNNNFHGEIFSKHFIGSIPDEIDGLPNLKVLLLSGNHFSGVISKQLCRLKRVDIMDLSNNSFSGTIPYCFHNITFGKLASSDFVYTNAIFLGFGGFSLPYKSVLDTTLEIQGSIFRFPEQVEIVFVMKYRSDLYKGLILHMVSALDLSFNKLTGSIPKSFSNLTQLESLDLSHNNLSGEIPSVLTDLTFLGAFNVNHNNLSGKIPYIKQLSTFEKSSYEGNPFLCGPPLEKSCTDIDESPPSPQIPSKANDGKWYEVDLPVFSIILSVSYVIFFLGVASILYINPHWRQRCFNLVEDRMYWCYFFALNTLKGLPGRMCH